MSDDYDARMARYLAQSIPQGKHPHPENEWIQVRLDVVQWAIDRAEWLEKGNAEWQGLCRAAGQKLQMEAAAKRVAIGHLEHVLNQYCKHHEQQDANTAARDWLASLGDGP